MKDDKNPVKEALLAPFDAAYRAVNGKLSCPYCTFYRGVAVGLIGAFIALCVAARGEE